MGLFDTQVLYIIPPIVSSDFSETEMDPIYQQLIDREQARINGLKRRISYIELRIVQLRKLAEDAFDDESGLPDTGKYAAMVVSAPHHQPTMPNEEDVGEFRDPKRMISTANRQLLLHIGTDGKSLDDMESFSDTHGLKMDRGAIRSFVNIYRNRFGFLEAFGPSRYRLTERGGGYLSTLPPINSDRGQGEDRSSEEGDNTDPAAGL